MLFLSAWLHDLDPIALQLGPVPIRWYGLSYACGFALAWLTLGWLAKRGLVLVHPERVGDLVLACVLGVVLGGRLGYVFFYQPSLLWTFFDSIPFWGVLAINDGGMASHGGIIGVILVAMFYCPRLLREHELSPGGAKLHLLDTVAFITPPGLMLGRIANFVNGELLGRVVAAPGESAPAWSIKYPQELLTGHAPHLTDAQQMELAMLLTPYVRDDASTGAIRRMLADVQSGNAELAQQLAPLIAARHPSQLYQAAAEGLILTIVLWVVWRVPRKPGVVGCWFLMTYGIGRIATEFWRLPDDHLAVTRFLGLSRGQWLSALMVLVGLVALGIVAKRNSPKLGGWGVKKVSVS